MKRPEGFDPRAAPKQPAPKQPARKQAARKQPAPKQADQKQPARKQPAQKPARQKPAAAPAPAPSPARDIRTERQLARARRRVERREVRRFTRRSHNRRVAIAVAAGMAVTLVGLVIVAVFSPLLALREVTVDGTSRIDAAEVEAALDDRLGTPLALLDVDAITRDLAAFPLIRSFVTEVVPPGTLLIHVSEREPVGTVLSGAEYELVDPAGIVLQQSAERIAGVPVIELGGADVSSPAFTTMVEVLLALPDSFLPQVDSISASTKDDVTLVLTGVGQRVAWGSAESSDRKADLLAALIALTDPASTGIFDVSAPGNGVFRPS